MRLLLGGLVAMAALAGATFAFAGSSGGPGANAYALVVGTSGTPQLIQAHTSGFVSVSVGPFGQGDYCLTPAPGVDVVHTAAVASEEAFYSNAAGFPTVRYPTAGPTCGANQLEVKTFDQNVALTNQIAFTVIVP
ncbi:MAG TPA: hypothetical protein VGH92_12340 [Gaiellaceae bacterium]|jgi:hypothetical protein